MRGVRLPLPIQHHRIHLTRLDQLTHHRPTSRELLAHQDREPDSPDLTPYWDLVHPEQSADESVSDRSHHVPHQTETSHHRRS